MVSAGTYLLVSRRPLHWVRRGTRTLPEKIRVVLIDVRLPLENN